LTVRTSILTFTLLALAPFLAAQQGSKVSDAHVDGDQARELYRRSVFAHGYMHGYEDGFHEGDLDFQTGRDPRDLRHMKQFRDANRGYHNEFGKLSNFRTAYAEGFRAGYSDAISGRDFRAVGIVRRAADGLQPLPDPLPPHNGFDHGFREGYASGRIHGEVAGRDKARYESTPSQCAPDSRPPSGISQEFCDGYTRGYLVGYDDGYVAQGRAVESNVTARR
jgi:hypothetical protein